MSDHFDASKSCGYCPSCDEIVNVVWFAAGAPACSHCATLIPAANFLGLKIGDV